MVTIQDRTLSVWREQIQFRVRIAGQGPPLVFLHGATGLKWDEFLDNLSQTHTVYAPEHPGTTPGDPDAIKPLDDFWDLVLCYYELFDRLELESPVVVGHSFGGMVASELAATDPKRVGKLVLISPIGLWRDDAPVKNWMSMAPDDLLKELFYEPDGPIAKGILAEAEDPEERLTATIQNTWNLGCTGKFTWPIPDKGLKKRIHRIQAPTLVIWGQQDGIAPAVYAKEFTDRIPEARSEIVDRAAHIPQLEQLATVSQLVQDFLRSRETISKR
jgi:pimeloyl-ACP methyl ester carboxylesterase